MSQFEISLNGSEPRVDLRLVEERRRQAEQMGRKVVGPRSALVKNMPEHHSWRSMKARCLRKTHHAYDRYGGAGITVCERWMSFPNFLEDMGPRPENTTLDRIDNTKGYSKENCRWATWTQQQRNRKDNVKVTVGGIDFESVSAAAEHFGIKRKTMERRVRKGVTKPEHLHLPVVPSSGENSVFSKLTREDAENIRSEYANRTRERGWRPALAKKYGVCTNLISMVVHNKTWL